MTSTAPRRRTASEAWTGPLAALVAAVLAAGLGELLAAALAAESSPFASIGSALIDLAPTWAKDLAIALFGTSDKLALLVGVAIALLGVAAIAGLLQQRRPPAGALIMLVLGAAGVFAATTRANATSLAWIPSATAGMVGALALILLTRAASALTGASSAEAPSAGRRTIDRKKAEPPEAALSTSGLPTPVPPPAGTAQNRHKADLSRRWFLGWSIAATVVGAAAAAGSAAVRTAGRTVAAVRAAIRLPAPATAAPAIPAGADLEIPGLAPVVTPNPDFYRIDTALIVPQVDPAGWSLRIHGMVEKELTVTWNDLLALPLEESAVTLACVSNEVGGSLIGNAVWLGYPIRNLLERARPLADADMVLSRSIDGFTAGTPIEALTDDRDALLAIGMNGEPLPIEHGFPARLVVPGLYGYVSATKWVVELEVTRFDAASAYWTDRGWSERGPIKLQSRIDVPRGGTIDSGETVIAGVAWQQRIGVSAVDVQIDDGAWREATLAAAISDDTWVQWSIPWNAASGDHTIRCRARNTRGETQTSQVRPVVPDGATGWHTRRVSVR
ncbi:molybdopterin-dependent oxidoreductase [Okibacterium endophyticum]